MLEQHAPTEWRNQVSDWLIQGGCLYMMAWGCSCSSWDDSVDLANLAAFQFGDIPEDRFVMTTWHADEPLREVFWYASHTAFHPCVALDRVVLLHVALQARRMELLRAFRQAQSDPA